MRGKKQSTKGDDSKTTPAKGSFADAMAKVDDLSPIDRSNLNETPTLDPSKSPHLGDPAADETRRSTKAASHKKHSARASRAQMRSLRAGKIRPQRTIDLHGFTLDRAHRRLCNEIERASDSGDRCVKVIHGKGHHSTPGALTIKEALVDWLEEAPLADQVIGSALAQPRDGGGGASYLLLREGVRGK